MLASVQFPLDEPVSDMGEAVEELKTCDTADIRRSRKYHRRAIQALRDDCYNSLSEKTRERLLKQLLVNLEALNKVLRETEGAEPLDDPDERSPNASSSSSSDFRLSSVVTWFW